MVLFYYSIYQPLQRLPFILRLKNYLGFRLYFPETLPGVRWFVVSLLHYKNNGAVN